MLVQVYVKLRDLKIIWKFKGPRIAETIMKNKAGKISLLHIETTTIKFQ